MKRLSGKFLLVALLFTPLCALSNGDPTDTVSALIGSSNPSPRIITDVQVVREQLYIKPGVLSEVRVRYLLHNNSGKDYDTIDYGFPVDYHGGGDELVNSLLIGDYYSESRYTAGWHDDYISNISFFADGQPLAYTMSKESALVLPEMPERQDYLDGEEGDFEYRADMEYYETGGTFRRWFYTRFSIKSGEVLTLEVNYTLRNSHTLPSIMYSNPFGGIRGYSSLSYDMSPAKHWGNGRAGELFVTVDMSGVEGGFGADAEEGLSDMIAGLPFLRNGDSMTYSARNFDFGSCDPIRINYSPKLNCMDMGELLKWRIPETRYTIVGSENQNKYPVYNLSDMDFSTAWVASDNGGVGGTITVVFNEPTRVEGILLLGGYHKSEETYFDNNRIKNVMIETRGSLKLYEWDDRGEEIVNSDMPKWREEHFYNEANFNNGDFYETVYLHNLIDNAISLRHNVHDEFRIREMVITIDKIYPGNMFNDTCVSELILLGRLSEYE